MPADFWDRAHELFNQVRRLTDQGTADFLHRECGSDEALRSEVESLLENHREEFLESPPHLRETKPPPLPESIGGCKIIGLLGEGGMGIVYLAEQREPIRRRVALKLLKPGMDTKEVIARFEAERQALAMMEHPNIARVYDAGAAEDGRPYFVMEHVQGVPLDDYCHRHNLSIKDRLEIFIEVCHGVHYAHQKGVVHRDIKPSNILVTALDDIPVAKIIDFGVAKATNQRLTEKTIYTEIGRVIGTPAYMSPEQAEMTGENVDSRTDIYSLGTVLYELLTGQLPLDLDIGSIAFNEVIRRIREEDPPTPSTRWSRLNVEQTSKMATQRQVDPIALGKALRGDLDWISMKAIEKERERRYGTVAELAADIGRYLAGDPVEAGPPSIVYKLKKYLAKNRTPVAAACVVFLALTVGIAASVVFAIDARKSAEIAKENEKIADKHIRENLVHADLKRLDTYRAEAEKLWPWPPERRADVARWLNKAEGLLSRLDDHNAELVQLRGKALPEDGRSGNGKDSDNKSRSYRFSAPEIRQRHEMLRMLVEGLEAFRDSDPRTGTVARVRHRLESFPSPKLFETRWEEEIASIRNPKKCPMYDGLEISIVTRRMNPLEVLWQSYSTL